MTIPSLFHSLSFCILTLLFTDRGGKSFGFWCASLFIIGKRDLDFLLIKIYAGDFSSPLGVAFNSSNSMYGSYDHCVVFIFSYLWFLLFFWQPHCFEDILDWFSVFKVVRYCQKVYCGPLSPANSFGILYPETLKFIFDIIFLLMRFWSWYTLKYNRVIYKSSNGFA